MKAVILALALFGSVITPAFAKGMDDIQIIRSVIETSSKIYVLGIGVRDENVAAAESAVKNIAERAEVAGKTREDIGEIQEEITKLITGPNVAKVLMVLVPPDKFEKAKKIAKDATNVISKIPGISQTQKEGGRHYISVLTLDNHKYGILIVTNDDSGKELLQDITYGEDRDTGDGAGVGDAGATGEIRVSTPPPGTPPEKYVAVPVPGPGIYIFEGSDYEAVCDNGYCVVLLPKNMLGDRRITVKNGYILKSPSGTIKVLDVGAATITRIDSIIQEKKVVRYVAKGQYPVSIEINIPKIYGRIPQIVANVPYIETDPVLKICMDTYGGNIAIREIAVEKAAKIIEDKINFETCALHIDNVTITTVKDDGYKVIVSFQVKDGDTPVYVPNTRLRIGGKNVSPQYDPTLRVYVASANVPGGRSRINITTEADGCSSVGYTKEIYLGRGTADVLKMIIGIIIVVAIAIAVLRIVWH